MTTHAVTKAPAGLRGSAASSSREPLKAQDGNADMGHSSPASGGSAGAKSRKKCLQCSAVLNLVEQNMPCRCQGVFCDRSKIAKSYVIISSVVNGIK
jgi:hypothetical protein